MGLGRVWERGPRQDIRHKWMTYDIFKYIFPKNRATGGRLLTPCEVAVKTVSPAIRALIAQKLLASHDLKQKEVAKILGTTQSAVSKYNKHVRGTVIPIESIPEVQTITDEMINLLLTAPTEQARVMALFCQACTTIRNNGLMCPLCHRNQKPDVTDCDFCNKP